MSNRLASAVLSLLLPGLAAAQVIAPASPDARYPLVEQLSSPGYSPVGAVAVTPGPAIPLWASPDGRLLALVSLSRDDGGPLMPRGPLAGSGADWRIIDATSLLSGGLRWQLAGGLAASATVSQSRSSVSCNATGAICAGDLFAADPTQSANLGITWAAPDASSSFSYGMSWLRGHSPSQVLGAVPGASLLPGSVAGLLPYRFDDGASVFARGKFSIGPDTRIDLGAGRGSAQLLPFALGTNSGDILKLDESSFGVGIEQGSWRGTIVGRVIDSSGSMLPGRRWTLLDFGLSWRTPWQAQLSVGTRSYLAPDADAPKSDPEIAPSRVPYVQYRQDL
ncbi:MAG: hypothetical protein ABIR16_02915 [Dokdonella sp.]